MRIAHASTLALGVLCTACPTTGKLDLTGKDGPSTFAITVIDGPSTMHPGDASNLRIRVDRIKGNSEEIGAVRFSLAGAPTGMVVTGFLGPEETTTTLALVAALVTPAGSYTLNILGEADGRISTVSFPIEVVATGSGVPVFSLSLSTDEIQLQPGTSASVTVNIARDLTLEGDVALSAIGLPTGVSASFTDDTVSGPAGVVTFIVAADAELGSTDVAIQGVHPNASRQATLTLTITTDVQPPTSFSYATNPATYIEGVAISANTVALVTGGTPTSFAEISLPAGLDVDPVTGAITGTPTQASPAASYVVRASNSAGSVDASITITVSAACAGLCLAAPSGWAGPVAVATDASAPAACGGSYATEASLVRTGFSVGATSCGTCSCSVGYGVVYYTYDDGVCTSPPGGTFSHIYTNSGTCYPDPFPIGAGKTGIMVTNTCSIDYCVTTTGMSPTYPSATWSSAARLCSPTVTPAGACAGSLTCEPTLPANTTACVYKAGPTNGVVCPSGYPNATDYYAGTDDTRNCSACSGACASQPTTCSVAQFTGYSSTSCGGSTKIATSSPTCFSQAEAQSWRHNITMNGSCTAGMMPTLTGALAPTGPMKVCCQ